MSDLQWEIAGAIVLASTGILFGILSEIPGRMMRKTVEGKSGWQRFLDFIEQPLFLVVLGIIGGIVGVLVYTPVFLVCDACVLLALHRSRAVADKRTPIQVFWYGVTFLVMSSILIAVGIILRNSARGFVRDIASAVVEVTKPTVVQPSSSPAQPQTQAEPKPHENPPTEVPKSVPINVYDLTGQRRDIFLALLNTQLEPRDTIRVGCIGWSETSCVAAGNFLILLSQAGWKIDSNRVFRFDPSVPRDGMTIAARTPNYTDNLPPHLGHWQAMDISQITVWYAFTWMQIPVGASGDPNMPEGTIGVYFGPEPTQVQARSASETRKVLHDFLAVFLVDFGIVDKACAVVNDACTMQRHQWSQTVSAYTEHCDCGLKPSWLTKWNSLATSGDSGKDPLDTLKRQKRQLGELITALR